MGSGTHVEVAAASAGDDSLDCASASASASDPQTLEDCEDVMLEDSPSSPLHHYSSPSYPRSSPPRSPPPPSSSSPLRPSSPPSSPPLKRAKRLTKSQQDAALLSLIDPIYLGRSIPTPPPSRRPHVSFSSITVHRFPLTPDPTKVPGDAASFYSVGLDYGQAGEREHMAVEEWEKRRGRERKKSCPEVGAEQRREVWEEAQERLQQQQEEEQGEEEEAGEEEREGEDVSAPSSPPVSAPPLSDSSDGSDTSADMEDVPAEPGPSPDGEEAEAKESSQPQPSHRHDLRARPSTPAPVVGAGGGGSKALKKDALAVSDVTDLTLLRVSRARVGCSCSVAPGDRVTKICSAPGLEAHKRRKKQPAFTEPSDDAAPSSPPLPPSSPPLLPSDPLCPSPPPSPELGDLSSASCECLRAGIGCNSNTCQCFSYCCRNPFERYLFNAGKVNAKRRKMLASMREAMEESSRKGKRKGQGEAAARSEGKSKSAGTKRRGKKGRHRSESL